jgi:hypothetical protein
MRRIITSVGAGLLGALFMACAPASEPEAAEESAEAPIESTHACYAQVASEGFLSADEIRSLTARPQTNAPNVVRVPAAVRNVVFRYSDATNATGLVVDCNLVTPIYRLAQWAAENGVASIYHLGGYYNRNVAGRSYASQHATGRAFDIRGVRVGGRDLTVSRDFAVADDNLLYRLAQQLAANIFTVLGPGYDPDHANHFHVELDGCLCQGLQLAPCTADTSTRANCQR